LGDVPRRFVTLIAEAVLDGKASLGGIAQSAGLDADDLESVLTGVRDAAVASATDDGWLDDWHVLAA
jgi:hypothetical protein